jgi:hypothetical protein
MSLHIVTLKRLFLPSIHPVIEPAIFAELARAYHHGFPKTINATATDANF